MLFDSMEEENKAKERRRRFFTKACSFRQTRCESLHYCCICILQLNAHGNTGLGQKVQPLLFSSLLFSLEAGTPLFPCKSAACLRITLVRMMKGGEKSQQEGT
ncbi:hypothetical protein KOW79_001462 [Hemibagrus wyckioides]|uniref:Uncharacterized protein n=1 Tax=Hemibagrus wyckioides TaxID=337641 RepID=A0A9D3SRP7_9TELE|nr:hypothetical protein KOW79_001462 [Hemibagrus wyckioides]